MDNLIPISAKIISPALVVQEVVRELESLSEIHVVGIDRHGAPVVWSAGTLAGRALAMLCLQDEALFALRPSAKGPNVR